MKNKLPTPPTIWGAQFRSAVTKLADPSETRRRDALTVLMKMKGWRWTNDEGYKPELGPRITEAFDSAVDALADPRTPENEKADHLSFLQFLAGGPEKRAEILKSLDKAKGTSA